jgi:hypothetical protein
MEFTRGVRYDTIYGSPEGAVNKKRESGGAALRNILSHFLHPVGLLYKHWRPGWGA